MSIGTVVFDPQNCVTFVAGGPRDIAQWLFPAQPHVQDLARLHAFEPQLCPDEGHWTDFAGNVDVMISA